MHTYSASSELNTLLTTFYMCIYLFALCCSDTQSHFASHLRLFSLSQSVDHWPAPLSSGGKKGFEKRWGKGFFLATGSTHFSRPSPSARRGRVRREERKKAQAAALTQMRKGISFHLRLRLSSLAWKNDCTGTIKNMKLLRFISIAAGRIFICLLRVTQKVRSLCLSAGRKSNSSRAA